MFRIMHGKRHFANLIICLMIAWLLGHSALNNLFSSSVALKSHAVAYSPCSSVKPQASANKLCQLFKLQLCMTKQNLLILTCIRYAFSHQITIQPLLSGIKSKIYKPPRLH